MSGRLGVWACEVSDTSKRSDETMVDSEAARVCGGIPFEKYCERLTRR